MHKTSAMPLMPTPPIPTKWMCEMRRMRSRARPPPSCITDRSTMRHLQTFLGDEILRVMRLVIVDGMRVWHQHHTHTNHNEHNDGECACAAQHKVGPRIG